MAWVEFVIIVVQSHFDLLSRYWCVCLVTFSGATQCFESIRAKLKFSFLLSHFTVLNKPQKRTDHERENLVFGRDCVP